MSITITTDEFRVFSRYIHEITGIHLKPEKAYLLETRMKPLFEQHHCSTFSELYYKIRSDHTKQLQKQVINAITTQETLFFRDQSPFEMFKYKLLPELIDKKAAMPSAFSQIPIRIWSAASSTGQEAYSIAICMKEILGDLSRFQVEILGTDISENAIHRAREGLYRKFEIERGLDTAILQKYFTQEDDSWRIKKEIQDMVKFRNMNLLEPFLFRTKFDIIFCRNVAIYFSPEDKADLFNRMADTLEPHGALVIGASEQLTGISNRFEAKRHLRSLYYELKAEAAESANAV